MPRYPVLPVPLLLPKVENSCKQSAMMSLNIFLEKYRYTANHHFLFEVLGKDFYVDLKRLYKNVDVC